MSHVALDPRDVIVPVMGLADDDGVRGRFLGTGSIIGDGLILLTANHMTSEWQGPLGFLNIKDRSHVWRIDLIERDPLHDLALYRIDEYRPERPLHIEFDNPPGLTDSLLTFEYSTTEIEDGAYVMAPATRLGHMTRLLHKVDKLGPAGVGALELSFPALHGASGAPVMYGEDLSILAGSTKAFGIVGVLVSNALYHALPSQIVTVLDDKNNLIEEIKFMLPQGLAVNVDHMRPMYDRALPA